MVGLATLLTARPSGACADGGVAALGRAQGEGEAQMRGTVVAILERPHVVRVAGQFVAVRRAGTMRCGITRCNR